ncbi:HNH endonuclease, partial [Escherichia albertii]|nr:HNH endonuclease [Escherichia albertii]MCZ8974406.1 HNH endonuclease [Escherichia albertii]MCZ9003957.1 HNH endonuclease [Escherichia albertii]MCZ9241223.1 HNH endonuclease [Escherichia albertii]
GCMTIKSNTPASDRYRLIEDYLYLDGDTVRYKKDSLKHPNHSHRAGDEIKTSINGSGYRQVCFAGIQMFVHVVVFALHNKRMPLKNIDHINGNRLDNSPKNLREASRIANSRNQKTKCNSRSGIKNVLWNKQKNKWAVQVRTDFGRLYFGNYEDLELACLVASEAINKYHGQYARVV